ncbi:ATP synthase F1 subunit gamma [Spiroplasma tabanidicola]|uniref:ATP synthase gamma chain n=1 Tax=Spiroplasma tabanidicola TaxID=324079 RepID=A0A6I6C9B7_9MOLU|nr:ATP synthase F1 subunit gamma [Spiroplasma tabanidicola]QGS51505.1 F0F1 ATP synthase subunit gamma [Spiroplasma tabanidicola]
MANLSELKNQIASVKDIGKITGAMELVATAKLKRISKRVGDIHAYMDEIYNVFDYIVSHSEESIYLKKADTQINKTLWVIITSNLGLCGGYNANVFKAIKGKIGINDEVVAIGNKAVSYCNSNKLNIRRAVVDVDVNYTSDSANNLASDLLSWYSQGEIDAINVVYTKFINNVTFEPHIINLFPIIKNEEKSEKHEDILLEPDAETVLATGVALYLNTIIFGTILESQLSEQASRRTAMEAATKNGKELSESLSIAYNRKRQENITQEISEIVGGANAQSDN